jgi:serine phosphatase RsbU (regulator of sigma subunit)/PAS domain-containing protein
MPDDPDEHAPDVLLLDVAADHRAVLEQVGEGDAQWRLREVRRGMHPGPGTARVVLVGAGKSLLASVQWAHAVLPEAKIAVLAPQVDHEQVRRLVRFAPGVPLDLELVDPDSSDLDAIVSSLSEAAGRERHYEHVLSSLAGDTSAEDSPQQALLGTLLENAPIGVVVVDLQRRVVGWNRAATGLLGCDASSAGRPVGGLFASPTPVETLVSTAFAGARSHEASQVTVAGIDDQQLDVEGALSHTEDGREVVVLLVQDAARRLRVEAERDQYGAHVDVLVDLSETLLSAPDPDSALRQLGAGLTRDFCDWVTFQAYDARGATARVVVEHRDPARADDVAQAMRVLPHAVTESTPSRRIAHGEGPMLMTVITEQMKRDNTPDPEVRALVNRLGAGSAIAVPLAGSSGVLGSMVVFRDRDRRGFDEADLRVAVEIGRRAGLVFEVLEANRRQRLVNEELQRSMLTDPPVLDVAEVVARYQPAAHEAQVGGDWYDSFLRADGTLVLTVGDVVGHDIRSAAAMGQVRGLLRGIGYSHDGGPASVVGRLDSAMQSLHPGITATAVVARLEPDVDQHGEHRLCWTSAGHPAPVLVRTDGRCDLLRGEADLLLGVLPGTARHEQEVSLGAGDMLLLYSDGLVERRGRDLEDGLAVLLETARALAGRGADEVCDGLLERMVGDSQEDDVCLIALRLR